MNIVDNRKIIIKDDYDVIVVGGGIAGVSAATSAARQGAKVLLMEKSIVLGGLATAGLISYYEPLCDGKGIKLIGGIAEELIKLSVKYGIGDLPEIWKTGDNSEPTHQRYAARFSPTIFAMVLDEFLIDNGVNIILDCHAIFPVMRGSLCEGIVSENKEGRVFYKAKAVVDATGDAGVFVNAGAPTFIGENYLSFVAHVYDDAAIYKYIERKDMLMLRKWDGAGSDMEGNGHPDGMDTYKGTTSDEITDFVLKGRNLFFNKIKNQNKETRDVSMLPFMPQFRKIRCIVGEHEFKAIDGEKFKDSIGSCGDFRPIGKGNHYQIPFNCLYNKQYDNIIAAGRIVSVDENGWEVARVIPTCALTGHAAGVAAAMCANKTVPFVQTDISDLQKTLKKDGVLFI